MVGLIKKDILMVRNNAKTLLLSVAIYVVFGFINNMDMSFIIPFMTVMISSSTFSYDDYNNWNAYAATLPNGRKNIVKGKYIATLSLTAIATIFAIVLSMIVCSIKDTPDIEETISSICGSFFAIIVLMSVLFPVLFKYGSEKGRIALFVVGFGAVGIIALLSKLIKIDMPNKFISLLNHYGEALLITASIIMILISYFISKKICLKKEF